MVVGDLCEADQELPDGYKEHDVNNCGGLKGGYDIFYLPLA